METARDVHKCQCTRQLCRDSKTECIGDQVHAPLLRTRASTLPAAASGNQSIIPARPRRVLRTLGPPTRTDRLFRILLPVRRVPSGGIGSPAAQCASHVHLQQKQKRCEAVGDWRSEEPQLRRESLQCTNGSWDNKLECVGEDDCKIGEVGERLVVTV